MSTVINSNPPALRIIATNELVTGPPAAEMLRRSLNDASGPLQVLDNACGGGILTAELYKLENESPEQINLERVMAGDIDEKMIEYVQKRSESSSWQNFEVEKFDQQAVPLSDSSFTQVFNNYGIFFCKDDEAALKETYRILKSGGTAGFTTWKSISWWSGFAMPAITALVPEAPALPDPGTLFPGRDWSDPAAIPEKLEKAGFQEINVLEYCFTPDVGAEEFAEACAVLTKVITNRFWSPEDNHKYADQIEPAYARYLNEHFPNGKWNGTMTAIISTGKKL